MIRARPAGFWIRALAALIDLAVFFVVYLSFKLIGARLLGADAETEATFFTLVFCGAYTTVLHGLAGQTLGKMLVGVRVISGDDGPPPYGAAFLRFIGYFVSFGTLTLGFVMAGLRHDKRALHDLIAGTRVERDQEAAITAPPPAETPGPVGAGVV
jgi:uncharacterized RDD family membrane protein YckC